MKKLILGIFVSLMLLSIPTHAQRVAPSADKVHPLLISSTIPDVSVKTIDGENVKLRELTSKKPTILIFYRGGWCPYCNQHLAELQQVEDKLYDMGYQVLALSPDRPTKLKESMNKHELDYTLLSDSPMNATKAFGLAFEMEESLVKTYKEDYNIDIEGDSGYGHHLLPAPAVYIIDTDGTVQFNYVNPNYRERIRGNILLAAAEAYSPN
ncbi:MAG: AhpC/TSA family protein [Balneolaceae bacterium]|nr:AhpC/TSA family protein [Balneolaceae bacterium]